MKKMTLALFASLALVMTGQVFAQGFQLPKMVVSSDAFDSGDVVPIRYTSHGDNVQPDFTITGAPDNTVSYAVIFHDIEVSIGGTGDVLHWLAWNIPSADIAEGSLPEGSVTGANIAGQNAYFGPGAPYADRYHHYVFEFYALSKDLDLPETAGRDELLAAMNEQGVVVAKAAYVGRYANASGD